MSNINIIKKVAFLLVSRLEHVFQKWSHYTFISFFDFAGLIFWTGLMYTNFRLYYYFFLRLQKPGIAKRFYLRFSSKLVISIILESNFSTAFSSWYIYFHYDTSNCQSQIIVRNKPVKVREQLNQFISLEPQFNCLFDY